MSTKDKLVKELRVRIADIKSNHRKKIKIFTVASTSKTEALSYFTPIRFNDKIVVIGIVFFIKKDILELRNIINKEFDYIFVDCDSNKFISKKNNILKSYGKLFSKEKIMSYKPNDITVDSCWNYILNHEYKKNSKVLVVGMGNIGTKLSIKLFESGINVYAVRKNHKKGSESVKLIKNLILNSENFIKYSKTIPNIINKVDIIITCTNKNFVLDHSISKKIKKNSTIIEVGKNNISPNAIDDIRQKKIKILRLDIGSFLINHLSCVLASKSNHAKLYGRKKVGPFHLVSGGFYGYEDDIVVDNFKKPRYIFGIANGLGDLKKRVNQIDPLIFKKILD